MENLDFDYSNSTNFSNSSNPSNYSNTTFDYNQAEDSSRRSYYIAHEVLFNLFCIIGICADVSIIYTIFRFKRLRTVANIFLANWAIADLCSLVVTPASYGLSSILGSIRIPAVVGCIIFELGSMLHVNVLLFVLLVAIEWCLAAYFPRASAKFRNHYRSIIGAVWVAVLVLTCFCIGYCMTSYYTSFPHILLLIACCAVLLIVIVLQSVRAVQKCKKRPLEYPTQRLSLATAFVLTYFLAFIKVLIFAHVVRNFLIGTLAACAVFSNSVVNFIMLYRFDKNFQACFLQAIRRTTGRYDESITEDFDKDSFDKASSVHVAFNNPTEELLTNAY